MDKRGEMNLNRGQARKGKKKERWERFFHLQLPAVLSIFRTGAPRCETTQPFIWKKQGFITEKMKTCVHGLFCSGTLE